MLEVPHVSANYFDIKRSHILSLSTREGVGRQETKNNSAVVVLMSHNGIDYGYNKFP